MSDRKHIKPFWWWFLGSLLFCVICWIILCRLGLSRSESVTSCIALGGVVAVVVGIFQTQNRITKQERQFKEQTELQQKQQRDARFTSGVELLGNPHESTRIGGAYSLYFLARDYEEYRTTVCEILCAHLRTIARKEKFSTEESLAHYPNNEVQAIIDLLFRKHENKVSIFTDESKKLTDLFLYNINFSWIQYGNSVTISNADFADSELNNVSFEEVDFVFNNFFRANLNCVHFDNAKLDALIFDESKLLNVFFNDAEFGYIEFNSAQIYMVDFAGTPLEGCDIAELTKDRREDS